MPLLPLDTPREYFSFYVDNFNSFKAVAATEKGMHEGHTSHVQMKHKDVFQVWGVERDDNKAGEGALDRSSPGAEQLGEAGLDGLSRKLRRAVASAVMQLLEKEPGEPRGSKDSCRCLVRPCARFSSAAPFGACSTACTGRST